MSQGLYRLGCFSARRPWVVIGSWLVLAVVVVGAASAFGHKLEDSFRVPGMDSQQANDLLTAAGTGQAGVTAAIVVTPLDATSTFFDSGPARDALAEVQSGAAVLPHVLSTSDPVGALRSGPAAARASGVVSPDGRVALVSLQYPVLAELSAKDLANLKDFGARARAGSPLRIELGGALFFAFEQPSANLGEVVGLLVAAVILFLAFGSLIATALPIGMAVFGLAVGVSSMSLLAQLTVVPSWAPQLGGMVGLGVGIDYALFVVTRYRDHLAHGLPVAESVGRAIATAGQPVVFAGGIVVVSVLGLAAAGVPFMTGGGVALAVVVAIMVAVSVTLLPAFLGLSGHAINRFGLPRNGSARPGWSRWVRQVTRHAWAYALGVTALLLALATPVLALRVGMPDDGALPTSRSERRAYDLVAQGFGPGRNGPLVIAVDLATDPSAVGPLAEAVAADAGIADVTPPQVNSAAGIASLVVFPTTGPQEKATRDTIERLRTQVIPAALAGSPAHAHVGGQMVNFTDVGVRVNDRLPVFIGAVLALSFLLLMLVFRSVLVPLKAVLLNLLSIGASYGVMVMVFQWGWGGGLIGLTSTVPIVSFIPMFMFAILFGLSMDYEVFLLSRVREEYRDTGDNEESVVRGIAGTGRVITAAALIMIAVFLAFVTGPDSATKMFGLGLATAILVDATLVRLVLVPATMKLLGDANWWLPGWLDRLLPAIEIEMTNAVPPPAATSDAGPADESPSERALAGKSLLIYPRTAAARRPDGARRRSRTPRELRDPGGLRPCRALARPPAHSRGGISTGSRGGLSSPGTTHSVVSRALLPVISTRTTHGSHSSRTRTDWTEDIVRSRGVR
jgi:RND superfamily putative drug exporter